MTPAARVAAAIEVLDTWLGGVALERALTNWARGHRFAGSKDRAAIRDHVFDAARCRRSFAALGGGENGRGLMIGALKAQGEDPAAWFTGEGYAPAPPAPGEGEGPALADLPEAVRLDCPDWLEAPLRTSLGEDFAPVMEALRHRAPLFLRANLARTTPEAAIAALVREGIEARPHPLSPTALEVTEGARKVQASAAFRDGLVELQDAASQAVVDLLPVTPGARVLDYCAGGGGKSLALAARGAAVTAHDIDAGRMRDLPERADRAGARLTTLAPGGGFAAGRFDLVLADAPCSGSGAWRRNPQGKWDLTPERLDELCALQSGIMDEISGLVAPGGSLAYATCSLLDAENEGQVSAFLARHPDWRCTLSRRFTPLDGGDGFFVALLTR
jgi:16S rRNA (cytosine967-C5)-methyltransferase